MSASTLVPDTALCASCDEMGTRRKPGGRPTRYRGQRYGVNGDICETCRTRFMRQAKRTIPGWKPGPLGRPEDDTDLPFKVSDAEIQATMAEIRRENTTIPAPRRRPYEFRRTRYAAMAAAERQSAYLSRRPQSA